VCCTRNTIRKVTMVVPVLGTSCQPLEKSKKGPTSAQRTTAPTAATNPRELPRISEARLAMERKPSCVFAAA
jgi:hypothetical protein